jgi:hypothetical protein
MPRENMISITFDDGKTSVEKIIAALKKGGLTVEGKPILIK